MAFDLDVAIRTWRKGLDSWRAFSTEDLDELESHLRDHSASLVRKGMDEKEAFAIARSKMGDLYEMEKAYKEVSWRKIRHKRQLTQTFLDQVSMYRGYVVIAFRSLTRNKGYSALNISGLAVGLACAFFVLLWTQGEMSVDQFHQKSERLFKVQVNEDGANGIRTWPNTPLPMAAAFETDYPDVETAILTLPITAAVSREGLASRETGYFASPGFFNAFTFPLIEGNAASLLDQPSGIVISEKLAVKYFGTNWRRGTPVIGQTLTVSRWQSNGGVLGQALESSQQDEFVITGVFQDVPKRSTLQFDVVLPVSVVVRDFPHVAGWGPRWFELALLLKEGVDAETFESNAASLLSSNVEGAENQSLYLQPFTRGYLHGSYSAGQESGGRIRQVYLIGLIGLAILLMACINFANLVTARAGQRAREIGVRKALGAAPSNLVQQFLGESVLTTLVAFVIAAILASLLLPAFNALTGTQASLSDVAPGTWAVFLGIALATGCFAGSYPAFYLATLNPLRVLRSQSIVRRKGEIGLRKGLVLFQFAVSAVLVVGTLTVYQQLRFLQTKDLGMTKDNVIQIRLEGDMASQFDAVSGTLLNVPGVASVSRSSESPVSVSIKNGNMFWEGKTEDEQVLFSVIRTDDQLANALELSLSRGRFLDRTRDTGLPRFVVNEAAVRAMGLEAPVGHPFAFGYDLNDGNLGIGQIVGVVEDFHTGSLVEEEIQPTVLRLEPEAARVLLIRVSPENTSQALEAVQSLHKTLAPGLLLEYSFLDEIYQAYYEDQAILGRLTQVFAFLALFIACLGLLGLSAFSVQQRTKEIGVRRVLGATKTQIFLTLSRDFISIVALSLLVALPLAYWGMQTWLSSFAYRIDLGVETAAATAALSFLLALAAVGFQAMRAIRLEPVRSLRSE